MGGTIGDVILGTEQFVNGLHLILGTFVESQLREKLKWSLLGQESLVHYNAYVFFTTVFKK